MKKLSLLILLFVSTCHVGAIRSYAKSNGLTARQTRAANIILIEVRNIEMAMHYSSSKAQLENYWSAALRKLNPYLSLLPSGEIKRAINVALHDYETIVVIYLPIMSYESPVNSAQRQREMKSVLAEEIGKVFANAKLNTRYAEQLVAGKPAKRPPGAPLRLGEKPPPKPPVSVPVPDDYEEGDQTPSATEPDVTIEQTELADKVKNLLFDLYKIRDQVELTPDDRTSLRNHLAAFVRDDYIPTEVLVQRLADALASMCGKVFPTAKMDKLAVALVVTMRSGALPIDIINKNIAVAENQSELGRREDVAPIISSMKAIVADMLERKTSY